MPAVRIFSLYAAVAVLIDFFLQVTCFVALMSLDAKRHANNRCDVFCCIKKPKSNLGVEQDGLLYCTMKNYFAPALLSQYVRPVVVSGVSH